MNQRSPEGAVSGNFVLPLDVLFIPVEELSEEVQQGLDDADGHLAVTRPGFRVPARLVDESTATLLYEFRQPSRIGDAVVRFCRQRALDADSVIDKAFPILQLFSDSRVLVPEDSDDAVGLKASYAPGQMVDSFEIIAPVQCTLDTEVFKARACGGQLVALKIERTNAQGYAADALINEASFHEEIGGVPAPALVHTGEFRSCRYIAVEWQDAVPAHIRATEIREGAKPGWQRRLHQLACAVSDAFCSLHQRRIIHGDIHTSNVLVSDDDTVTLIDFGLTAHVDAAGCSIKKERAGLVQFLDPDTARRALEERPVQPASLQSECYALAAIVYELITGQTYLDFSVEVSIAYGQIIDQAPLSFTERGFERWSLSERVLDKALSKSVSDRYPSTASFCNALRLALPPAEPKPSADTRNYRITFINRFIPDDRTSVPDVGSLFNVVPIASPDNGMGGYAWFLMRMAQLRGQPDLLAIADIWCRRALVSSGQSDAFFIPETSGQTGVTIGTESILHRLCGLHYIQALICHARGDHAGLHEQVVAFLDTSERTSGIEDVTLGRAGRLIALTTLLQANIDSGLDTTRVQQAIRNDIDQLFKCLDERCRNPSGLLCRQPLSFAHGRAGVVYALLRATMASGHLPSESGSLKLLDELDRVLDLWHTSYGTRPLATNADLVDRHQAMQQSVTTQIPGWCNGSAGLVALFTLAHQYFGKEELYTAATLAAQHAVEHPDRHGHLCCGLAGRVYALLDMFRHTGDIHWLRSARTLGSSLCEPVLPQGPMTHDYSLFWGPLGSALAMEELAHPDEACMPLFGELWSRHVAG